MQKPLIVNLNIFEFMKRVLLQAVKQKDQSRTCALANPRAPSRTGTSNSLCNGLPAPQWLHNDSQYLCLAPGKIDTGFLPFFTCIPHHSAIEGKRSPQQILAQVLYVLGCLSLPGVVLLDASLKWKLHGTTKPRSAGYAGEQKSWNCQG